MIRRVLIFHERLWQQEISDHHPQPPDFPLLLSLYQHKSKTFIEAEAHPGISTSTFFENY